MSGGGFVKKWMTVPEVAAYFSCSRRYVYTLAETGKLTIINLSGQIGKRGVRIESASVLRLEQASKITPEDYAE